jgi:integrase
MPARHLTDAFVRSLKPPDPNKKNKKGKPIKQVVYIDTTERGWALLLVVSYGGTKAFRALTYVNGKARSRKLGTYPRLSLKQARDTAREYFENPDRFETQAQVGSFKETAEKWFKRHVESEGLRSAKEIRRQLERYVYPRWGARKFLEIRRREVNELLDDIADNHGGSQANAVLATLRAIMQWHQARDEHYTSPIVRGMRRKKPSRRERILNDSEIRAVWKAAEGCGTFGAMVRVLLLTAQRRTKVATMRWDDIVDDVWTIRKEDREKGTGGKLRLPRAALEVIAHQPRIAGNLYVFPAARGRGPINSFGQGKRELAALIPNEMRDWTLHDLRRTARSLLSRAGVLPHIAERVLGHAQPTIQQVYDRHEYEPEKADALQRLADLLANIINPPEGNVVALRR